MKFAEFQKLMRALPNNRDMLTIVDGEAKSCLSFTRNTKPRVIHPAQKHAPSTLPTEFLAVCPTYLKWVASLHPTFDKCLKASDPSKFQFVIDCGDATLNYMLVVLVRYQWWFPRVVLMTVRLIEATKQKNLQRVVRFTPQEILLLQGVLGPRVSPDCHYWVCAGSYLHEKGILDRFNPEILAKGAGGRDVNNWFSFPQNIYDDWHRYTPTQRSEITDRTSNSVIRRLFPDTTLRGLFAYPSKIDKLYMAPRR